MMILYYFFISVLFIVNMFCVLFSNKVVMIISSSILYLYSFFSIYKVSHGMKKKNEITFIPESKITILGIELDEIKLNELDEKHLLRSASHNIK
jgi:uncharacterized protein YqgC (DUF456 family)